jgi:hypothetical protein
MIKLSLKMHALYLNFLFNFQNQFLNFGVGPWQTAVKSTYL